MPFVPLFTIAQQTGALTSVILTDTSTGSDVAIVSRRAFFQKYDATYLVPTGTTTNYVVWNYAASTITINNLLFSDFALNVTVQWLDVDNEVLHTKTILSDFSMYNNDFQYSLIYDEATGQASLNDTNWYTNRIALMTELNSAQIAVTNMSNITSAQSCINRATYLRNNKSKFY